MALPTAWGLLTWAQRVTLTVAVVLPYVFLYLSAFSDPGIVTPANVGHHMTLYPYDFALFHPGVGCRTCATANPAGSKHCPICKGCIARLDHHCIFINNCVGAGNHHWFLLLLLSTGVLTLYGGTLGLSLIAAKIRERDTAWALLPWASSLDWHDWLVMWSWGLQDRVGLGSVSLLTLMTSPLVWGLVGYNVWNVWSGVTTNESMKWCDLQCDMDDGLVFRRRMAPGRPKDPHLEAPRTRWPAEPDQIIVARFDGQPPPAADSFPGEGEWEPVWRLRDVENLYDLGFWDNLVDIFVPGYLFTDPDEPVAEVRGRRRRKKKPKK